jgi:periplasmic copper chaperone A
MKTRISRKAPMRALAVVAGLCAVPALAEVVGSDGWSRATPPGAKEAVGYLVLTNRGDEERSLLKITSPISDEVRIHRSSVDSQGVAKMWPVGFLRLQPGETVRFDPNGLHVMLSALKKPLKVGDKVPLTMQFDGFLQPFTVMLEVRPLVPAAAPDHSQHKH